MSTTGDAASGSEASGLPGAPAGPQEYERAGGLADITHLVRAAACTSGLSRLQHRFISPLPASPAAPAPECSPWAPPGGNSLPCPMPAAASPDAPPATIPVVAQLRDSPRGPVQDWREVHAFTAELAAQRAPLRAASPGNSSFTQGGLDWEMVDIPAGDAQPVRAARCAHRTAAFSPRAAVCREPPFPST